MYISGPAIYNKINCAIKAVFFLNTFSLHFNFALKFEMLLNIIVRF